MLTYLATSPYPVEDENHCYSKAHNPDNCGQSGGLRDNVLFHIGDIGPEGREPQYQVPCDLDVNCNPAGAIAI